MNVLMSNTKFVPYPICEKYMKYFWLSGCLLKSISYLVTPAIRAGLSNFIYLKSWQLVIRYAFFLLH